ncbi:MAG: hypothetical protein H6603_03655 [Flavobacteriales bacterium]|nr:hypothetical protein [Flavobacteriales bacterium]
MKHTLLTLSLCLASILSFSQDMIIMRNADEVEAKVLEINDNEVKYKKYSNPDGPTYTVDRDFIFMIKYANGEKEVFNTDNSANEQPDKAKQKQTRPKGHFISVNGGAGIPFGKYASTAGGNEQSFYAKTGWFGGLQGAYFIIPEVGVGANLGAFGNSVNKSAIDEDFRNSLGYNAQFSSKYPDYINVYALAGPYFQLPTKVVNISLNGKVGAIYAVEAYYEVTLNQQKVTQRISGGFGFCYGGGLDFRFKISPKLFLNLGGEVISSTFDGELKTSSGWQSQKNNYTHSVQVINVYLGLAFNLHKAE